MSISCTPDSNGIHHPFISATRREREHNQSGLGTAFQRPDKYFWYGGQRLFMSAAVDRYRWLQQAPFSAVDFDGEWARYLLDWFANSGYLVAYKLDLYNL